jgi:hypothetical protein
MAALKEKIELILNNDGTGFLNFWDFAHANDVIVDITPDGRLMKSDYIFEGNEIKEDENGEAMKTEPVEITFKEYMDLVKASVESRKI